MTASGNWTDDLFDLARTCALGVDESIRSAHAADAIEATQTETLDPPPVIDARWDVGAEYEVLGVLGRGGMGEVHLARQRLMNRKVAIKRLKPDEQSPAFHAALLREGVITSRLEHPNIVPVHALGVDADGRPVIVMKRVEGKAWSKLDIRHSKPDGMVWSNDPIVRHLEVFLEVCRAVAFAHAQGYAHRDIKPDNVMVGDFGEVYLLDWGAAVELGTPAFGHAKRGAVALPLGTPSFMAPEMIVGDGVIDAATDVYLLGATLHRMLTGQARHQGADLATVLRAAIESEPHAYPPEVPEELAHICNRATARDKSARFSSAMALHDAVVTYTRHKGSLDLTAEAERLAGEAEALAGSTERGALTEQRRVFVECRFAFTRALSEWRENERARRGLARAVETMIETELRHDNLDAAEALADEAALRSPRVAEGLSRARAERAHQKQALHSLRDLAYQHDADVARGPRALLAALFVVCCLLTVAGALAVRTMENAHLVALCVTVPFILAMAGGSWLGRQRLLANVATRRIMSMLAICIAIVTLHRVYGFLFQPSLPVMLADDLLIIAAVVACIAIGVDRLYFVPVAMWLVGSAVMHVYRGDPAHVFAPSMILGTLSFSWLTWLRDRRGKLPLTEGEGERQEPRDVR